MICKACRARIKDWVGDDPKCAFLSGVFSSSNWNCAALSPLRSILYDVMWCDTKVPGVMASGGDDRYHATVSTLDVEGAAGSYALWMSWYKNRGRTEQMWLLFGGDEDTPPRRPTEDELAAISAHYEKVKENTHD